MRNWSNSWHLPNDALEFHSPNSPGISSACLPGRYSCDSLTWWSSVGRSRENWNTMINSFAVSVPTRQSRLWGNPRCSFLLAFPVWWRGKRKSRFNAIVSEKLWMVIEHHVPYKLDQLMSTWTVPLWTQLLYRLYAWLESRTIKFTMVNDNEL